MKPNPRELPRWATWRDGLGWHYGVLRLLVPFGFGRDFLVLELSLGKALRCSVETCICFWPGFLSSRSRSCVWAF